jgi:hypothetical protein
MKILNEWIPLVEKQSGEKLKHLFTDRGGEYLAEAENYLKTLGIKHEQTAPYSSQTNGVAERLHRTLFDIVRPIMITSGMPTPFWGEAIYTALEIRNRLPTKSLKDSLSPYEAWHGVAPDINVFIQFGCLSYAKQNDLSRGNKANLRSIECSFIGYEDIERSIYRLWDHENNRTVTSRDVIFIENEFISSERFKIDEMTPITVVEPETATPRATIDNWAAYTTIKETSEALIQATIAAIEEDPDAEDSEAEEDNEPPAQPPAPSPVQEPLQLPAAIPTSTSQLTAPPSPNQSPTPEPLASPQPAVAPARTETQAERTTQSGRIVRRPNYYHNYMIHADGPIINATEPQSMDEALTRPDADKWIAAAEEEIESLREHNTYEVVARPSERRVIGSKWVFRLKDPESEQPRYKARLVAQGYSQVEGIDYDETRASVVRMTTIRTLLAIAAMLGMLVHQFDVITAFLNGTLDIPIYIELPPYFTFDGQHLIHDPVLKLNRALYGLKQAGYEWLRKLRNDLRRLGFTQFEEDENIFTSASGRLILAVYVDDILVFAFEQCDIDELCTKFDTLFKYRAMGPVKKFLSMDIHRPNPRGDIYVSQSTYLQHILNKFGMNDCNAAKSPGETSVNLHKRVDTEEAVNAELYRQIIGSCMHAATIARPDITYMSNKLSQYYSDPSMTHLKSAKHLLRYLKGHLNLAVHYKSSGIPTANIIPVIYADASFASDNDDNRSTSGYVVMLNGGVISFQSQKQKLTALSSMEAEFIALTEACREALFIRKLLREFNMFPVDAESPVPIKFVTDARAVLNNIKNNVHSSRTKHFRIKTNFIRELYENGEITIEHVESAEQPADVLTKPLGPHKHQHALDLLNLVELPNGA